MLHLVHVIDIHGDVDQSGLDRLRAHLDLTKRGRLTDDWDQSFGYRKIEGVAEQYTKISLYRVFDGSWLVDVAATERLDPNSEDLASLRTELVGAIEAAGYAATVRTTPTHETYSAYIARTTEPEGTDPPP